MILNVVFRSFRKRLSVHLMICNISYYMILFWRLVDSENCRCRVSEVFSCKTHLQSQNRAQLAPINKLLNIISNEKNDRSFCDGKSHPTKNPCDIPYTGNIAKILKPLKFCREGVQNYQKLLWLKNFLCENANELGCSPTFDPVKNPVNNYWRNGTVPSASVYLKTPLSGFLGTILWMKNAARNKQILSASGFETKS